MINNARAESDAMSSNRGADKVYASTERVEYADSKRNSPISEDGAPGYGDDLAELQQRRAGHMKRGSV
jgi:hypothetical protein